MSCYTYFCAFKFQHELGRDVNSLVISARESCEPRRVRAKHFALRISASNRETRVFYLLSRLVFLLTFSLNLINRNKWVSQTLDRNTFQVIFEPEKKWFTEIRIRRYFEATEVVFFSERILREMKGNETPGGREWFPVLRKSGVCRFVFRFRSN